MSTNSTVFTVFQVNQAIKQMLEEMPPFRNLYVQGEISNYKAHSSGHRYFTLKDERAALSAVMFRSDASRLRFRPDNGMKVIARGRISSYPKSGQVQMYVVDMMPDGVGSLTIAFQQLKQRLYQEGLFDTGRKKPIPAFPSTIAIVTSPTGAAVRDMIRILKRRYPIAVIEIHPVRVQGEGAAQEIAQAIADVNERGKADLIITGRGGGSLEDLWAFNEEIVARAIAASDIPVISAVGHEPDVTISDFAADARASTPSNAAELCVPDRMELQRLLLSRSSQMAAAMQNRLKKEKSAYQALEHRRELKTPTAYLQDRRFALDHMLTRMQAATEQTLAQQRQQFGELAAYLDAFSPLKVLSRGYSVVHREDGRIVTSSALLKKQDHITVRFAKGSAVCLVEQIKRK
ncbi:MAG: exodeoxyribonuclease VII large subunit [Eubacteriales bacterium]|nr:exodeoxyribonuclease VII large subunit [Eubacteriales bacterium]